MRTVTVLVARFDRSSGRYESTYEVKPGAGFTILDILRTIAQRHDPTLSFRFSCRVGMCGTCALLVDGREALACQTPVRSVGRTIRIGPLRNLPVLKDLVVDPEPFFVRYRRVDPAGGTPHGQTPAGLETSGDCITCGACLSACSMAGVNEGYVGPAALFRALRLVEEADEAEAESRIRGLATADGMYGCRGHLDCLDACPKDLAIPHAIHKLKRMAARRVLAFGPRR